MARAKPQGKKKGASKAKSPEKQGQGNWHSRRQVIAAAAAAGAAVPVAVPTTNGVVPPAGSLGTVAASGNATPSVIAAATTVIAAATSSTGTSDHSATAAAPPYKKGVSMARAPAEVISAMSGIAAPLANAAAGASAADFPESIATNHSAADAVPPPKKGALPRNL